MLTCLNPQGEKGALQGLRFRLPRARRVRRQVSDADDRAAIICWQRGAQHAVEELGAGHGVGDAHGAANRNYNEPRQLKHDPNDDAPTTVSTSNSTLETARLCDAARQRVVLTLY